MESSRQSQGTGRSVASACRAAPPPRPAPWRVIDPAVPLRCGRPVRLRQGDHLVSNAIKSPNAARDDQIGNVANRDLRTKSPSPYRYGRPLRRVASRCPNLHQALLRRRGWLAAPDLAWSSARMVDICGSSRALRTRPGRCFVQRALQKAIGDVRRRADLAGLSARS